MIDFDVSVTLVGDFTICAIAQNYQCWPEFEIHNLSPDVTKSTRIRKFLKQHIF